jgi:hypothetical protein
LFGFARSELIGQDVSVIMPVPYCDSHSSAMTNMFASDFSLDAVDQRHRDQPCFALHKSGYIVPVQVTVRHAVTGSGSSLLGMIALKESSYQFAIINPQQCITSCTRGFAAFFQLNAKSLQTNHISVTSVFPSYSEHLTELSSSEFVFLAFALTCFTFDIGFNMQGLES